jgi:hypothetical protein
MRVVIALLALSTTFVASAAIAADAKELLRDNLTFCSQFVIHDPDPRIVLNHMRDCCAYNRNFHDCRMYDWDTTDWGPIER